jgi:GT2 family glycosyltransferase
MAAWRAGDRRVTDLSGPSNDRMLRRTAHPAIHGVLVTYRRPDDLEVMVRRLAEQERGLDTLLVVDNDPAESARGLTTRLAARNGVRDGPRVTYVASGANLGPAGGIALGMRHVLSHAADHDWVVPLDDDNPPRRPDMLAELERFATRLREQDPTVGAVGVCGARFEATQARGVRIPDDELNGAVRTDWIGSGNFPLYSVCAVRAVGVFDERLFFGFDDLEYGLRLGAAGFGVYAHGGLWHDDRAFWGHLADGTRPSRMLDEATWRRYYSMRNLVYILRKRGHHVGAARLAARNLAKPVYNLPRSPVLAARHLALTSRAILDAYRGRMGRTVSPAAKS